MWKCKTCALHMNSLVRAEKYVKHTLCRKANLEHISCCLLWVYIVHLDQKHWISILCFGPFVVVTLSLSKREREKERWSETLIETEREMEGPLFNYLPLTVFVICVDLLSGAKENRGGKMKWGLVDKTDMLCVELRLEIQLSSPLC